MDGPAAGELVGGTGRAATAAAAAAATVTPSPPAATSVAVASSASSSSSLSSSFRRGLSVVGGRSHSSNNLLSAVSVTGLPGGPNSQPPSGVDESSDSAGKGRVSSPSAATINGPITPDEDDPFGLAEVLCHNPRCRKLLALDPEFLDLGPSYFAGTGFSALAQEYSQQLEQQGGDPVRALFDAVTVHTGVTWPLCVSCARKATQVRAKEAEAYAAQVETQEHVLAEMSSSVGADADAAAAAAAADDSAAPKTSAMPPPVLAARSGDLGALRELDEMDQELRELELEEQRLQAEVDAVMLEREELSRDAVVLQRAEMTGARLESDYWRLFSEFAADAQRCADQRAAVCRALASKREILDSLVSTHTLNDAFHVWHDGHFGTINRFRLGRLPSQPVDWHELNAAWGLAAHLLYCLQKTLRVEFRAWKVLPHGSFSRIQRRSDDAIFELYGSSDISLGRLFWYRRFDQAMVGFLQCISELGQYAARRDRSRHFKLPHTIEKDRIGEVSIRSQFNNEEAWTKALKCTLSDLKYIVAFVTIDHVSKARRMRAKQEQAPAASRQPEAVEEVSASGPQPVSTTPGEAVSIDSPGR